MRNTFALILGVALLSGAMLVGFLTASPAFAEVVPTNVMCPVTPSEPVDPDIFIEYEGRRVHFCCQRCRRQFEAEPEKYASNLTPAAVDTHDHRHANHEGAHDDTAESTAPDAAPTVSTEHAHSFGSHDHSTDHASQTTPGFVGKLLAWIGRFHPVIVHFPIALLIAAAMAEGVQAVKDWPRLRTGVFFMVYLGAASAIFAAGVGWLNASYGSQPESMAQTLSLHRWLGVATAVWSVWLAWHAWGLEYGGSCRAFRINLAIAVILVSATGHFGGTLVFGEGYFAW